MRRLTRILEFGTGTAGIEVNRTLATACLAASPGLDPERTAHFKVVRTACRR